MSSKLKALVSQLEKAVEKLRAAVEAPPSEIVRDSAIQRFEFTYELAWKTLRDYLEENGLVMNPVTPRTVSKEGFSAKILDDGQVWIDMTLHRNLLAHTYDIKVFEKVIQVVEERYLTAFDRLHGWFLERMIDP